MKQTEFAIIVLGIALIVFLANSLWGYFVKDNQLSKPAIITTTSSSTAQQNAKMVNSQKPATAFGGQIQPTGNATGKNTYSDFVIENGSVYWVGSNKKYKVNLSSNFGADAETFRALNSRRNPQDTNAGVYAVDKKQVYLSNASGYHIISVADAATFSVVSADKQVSKDKNYVYLATHVTPELDPGTIRVLDSAPPQIQNPSTSPDAVYIESQGNLYVYNPTNTNGDPVLVLLTGTRPPVYLPPDFGQPPGGFVFDKNKVYCNGRLIDITATATLANENALTVDNPDTYPTLCM